MALFLPKSVCAHQDSQGSIARDTEMLDDGSACRGRPVLRNYDFRRPVDPRAGPDNTKKKGGIVRTSTDRILTTHVGSLPRPDDLIAVMLAEDRGEAVDAAAYDEALKRAVRDVVQKQLDLGVDVVDDGEFSKRGFAVYAHERLAGLESTGTIRPSPWAESRESQAFPEFYEPSTRPRDGAPTPSNAQMACTGADRIQGPGPARARSRQSQGRRGGGRRRGGLRPGDLAQRHRRQPDQRALRQRRRAALRHRRRDERKVQKSSGR